MFGEFDRGTFRTGDLIYPPYAIQPRRMGHPFRGTAEIRTVVDGSKITIRTLGDGSRMGRRWPVELGVGDRWAVVLPRPIILALA
jgi:hypothetical protein